MGTGRGEGPENVYRLYSFRAETADFRVIA